MRMGFGYAAVWSWAKVPRRKWRKSFSDVQKFKDTEWISNTPHISKSKRSGLTLCAWNLGATPSVDWRSVDWQTVASEPLQLGLLISSKTKTKGRESREKGHALTPVAEANLLWFAALLEPGATCPFTCELKSVESTGAKNPPVGRLHFSMELTVSSAGDSPQGQADSSEVYLRVWLNTVQGYFSGARAILKLGPSQELLVPVQPMREDLGHLGGGAVSAQPIWNTRDGICSSPSPPCIFVQIWQGAELCGLAKLILSQLPPESCQNIALQGYEKLLEGELDIFAVTTDRSIGKLHVLVHAGSQEVLQVLQAPAPPDCEFTLEDAAAGIMILACHDIEELEQSITQQLQTGPLNLRACEPGLTKKEADSLTVWMKAETSTNEGSVWMALKPRIEAAHQSFDQLVKDVGEVSSTSVALDFLDVAAPSKLQRQDIARVLRLRGIELGWNTLESLFLALGCQSSQALPAAYFTRLFKARAEKRIADIATLRQLEGQVLAWAGQLESPRKLVNSFSKSDGTMDLMGLKVLLSQGPVSRNDLDRLAGWRFEELGARPGGSVPSESVLQWLTREIKVQQPEKGTQACLPIDGNTAQQEQAHLDQRLLAFSHKNVKVDEPGHQHELNPVSTHIERSVGYPVVPTEVATGVSWETVERKERLEARVEERAERASIQLSQPVRRIDDLQKLEEAFSTLLKLPLHRVKVFGAEGASRICLLIREESHQGHLGHPKGLSAEAALRDLAQQMRDPAKLTATALDIYFS
eukprot:g7542.t1